jgi:hypothetical protein
VPLHPADTITPFLFARFLEDDLAVEAIRDGGYQDAAWTSEPSRSGSWANLIAHSRTLGQHDDEPPEATRVGFIAAGRNEHDHVVRWDPARVRAELLARRQTLVHHRPTDVQTCFGDSPSPDLRCLVCHNAGTMLRWPCLTVRLLALPHTAHPGFEPGWTV